jgi:hypothetical protein
MFLNDSELPHINASDAEMLRCVLDDIRNDIHDAIFDVLITERLVLICELLTVERERPK